MVGFLGDGAAPRQLMREHEAESLAIGAAFAFAALDCRHQLLGGGEQGGILEEQARRERQVRCSTPDPARVIGLIEVEEGDPRRHAALMHVDKLVAGRHEHHLMREVVQRGLGSPSSRVSPARLVPRS